MRQLIQESCSNHLLHWEKIEHDTASGWHTYRAPVFGGWLLRLINQNAHPIDTDYQFIADPAHQWGAKKEDKKEAKKDK